MKKISTKVSSQFPALLVTGARQVGKTTLFKYANKNRKNHVTLDNPAIRLLAKEDPALLLKHYTPPVIIESLAVRIAILNLLGFSCMEISGKGLEEKPFSPTMRNISIQKSDLNFVYEKIWRGFFPFLALNQENDWNVFYSSHIQTYIQRDIRDLSQIGNEYEFLKFLNIAATRTGQLLNISDMTKETGISVNTAKKWFSILQATSIIYLLKPWYLNIYKRLVKTPKLYFLNTGLAAYLKNWTSPLTLETGAMSVQFFETFVIGEILKSFIHNGKKSDFYYYRDKDKKEIYLLILNNGRVIPPEIKKTASPTKKDIGSIFKMEKLGLHVESGVMICFVDDYIPLSEKIMAIPITALL